jgi:PKD repeat protein
MYIEFTSAPVPPVADFSGSPTSGVAPLTVNFTDLSTGSPTSWSWDFGDGGTSFDQHPTYIYNDTGTYAVSLTASNAYGSDNETKVDYITVTEAGGTMHVHGMVVGRRKAGPNYLGTCTVTIHDELNQAVPNATVYVTATGPTGGDYNGTTLSDGTVYFETSGIKKPTGEWCFEVTNVTHATMTYNSAGNDVTMACESGPVYRRAAGILPTEFSISNYPNPFNPSTVIEMSLPVASEWNISIFNIVGRKVAEFNGFNEAGRVMVSWDASNQATGVYFYKGRAGQFSATRKMMLLK